VGLAEDAAVSSVGAAILGSDERIHLEERPQEELSENERLLQQCLREKEQELHQLTEKYDSLLTLEHKLEEDSRAEHKDTTELQQRYSLLSFKLAEEQKRAKFAEARLIQQLQEMSLVLERERILFGKAISALEEELSLERNHGMGLLKQLGEQKEKEKLRLQELLDVSTPSTHENETQSKEAEEQAFEKKEATEVPLYTKEEKQATEEEILPQKEEEKPILEATGEIQELNPQVVVERLHELEKGTGHLHKPIKPAVVVGGRRIHQSSKPHLVAHKPTLVEKRDEKRTVEAIGTDKESTEQALDTIEHQFELQQKEEKLAELSLKSAPAHSKAVPSTYFPPEPKQEVNHRMKGGVTTFQPPMHGHQTR